MSLSGAVAYYRLYAARCLEVSRQVLDTNSKANLLTMAQAWIALANQADKNRRSPTLVYETPEPPHPEQSQISSAPTDAAKD